MGFILYIIYNVTAPLILPAAAFLSFLSPRHSFQENLSALKERLFPAKFKFNSPPLWFHAASLGEVRSIRKIIERLSTLEPETPILITVSTLTGRQEALKLTPYACVLPADLFFLVKKFISINKPRALFIIETELWPNLIRITSQRLPVKLINARISDKTFSRYLKISPLLRYCLSKVVKVAAQSKKDAERYSRFIPSEKISCAGNIKYDSMEISKDQAEKESEKLSELLPKGLRVIVFGSTHPDEEKIISESFRILTERNESVAFVFVPRHINKVELLETILKEGGMSYSKLSSLKKGECSINPLLIVDEIGILPAFYSLGEICFVGGTLDSTGGHNVLEPSIFSKPVIFGPNFANAAEAAERLIENKGGFIVKDSHELAARIRILLNDRHALKKAGENSRKALDSLKGATARIILEIIN